MLRACFIVALLVAWATACGDGGSTTAPATQNGDDGPPVTAVPRPASVPTEADEVQEDTSLGRIERTANAEPEGIDTRTLLTADCENDVMVLFTDQETIHAEFQQIEEALPCDRFWDDETRQAFSSQEVAIRMTVTSTRFQIFIETLEGAQAEFTVEGIWIE